MKSRVVVKIGSSSLTSPKSGLDNQKLSQFVSAVAHCHAAGHEIIVVTSAAIAAGFRTLGLKQRPTRIEEKQAAASVGQGRLMHAYAEAFSKYKITVGQVLLTRQDFAMRESYNNALNTFSTLLKHHVVPIVNENDTVAIGEINFGDNDFLAALVASLVKADFLIMLTDTDGLYDKDPRSKGAKILARVESITPEILAGAKGGGSAMGTGGMFSKVKAASRALANGIRVYVGRGAGGDAIEKILNGKGGGTYFGQSANRNLRTKKQWIAFHAEPSGKIFIDSGAVSAIVERGKSLLPVGVKDIAGSFSAGEVVEVYNGEGALVGKGIINYSSANLKKFLGKSLKAAKPGKVQKRPEVIHRDDWVSLSGE